MTYTPSFIENLTFGNNRYKTKFPFKKYNEILPDNFYLSKIRLNNLKTCLDKNENLMIEYDKIIKKYINDGVVEPVGSITTSYDLGSVHYLPHRAVARQNRDTTKVRIVFDASAHVYNEPSLNDVLYSGPCMLPLLPSGPVDVQWTSIERPYWTCGRPKGTFNGRTK